MGWVIDLSERGGDVRRFEESLKMAKSGIKEACEIFEDMKEEFSERSGYSERRHDPYRIEMRYRDDDYRERDYYRDHDGYSSREWDDMRERRMRARNGQYR